MGRSETSSRLDRLEQLVGLLKSGDFFIAADLAKSLGVSKRTLMRDLDILKERGYPIETDQGRGGGIRLYPHWGIGRLNLSYKEVIDLLLSLAIMEKIGSPIFLTNLKAVRNKLSSSFPQEQRKKVNALRKRLIIGDNASDLVMSSLTDSSIPASNAIYLAFFDSKVLEMTYHDAVGATTRRAVEPHYLMMNWPVWYLLAWDHLRQDIRCFRMDRISRAKVTDTTFKLRAIKAFIEGYESYVSSL